MRRSPEGTRVLLDSYAFLLNSKVFAKGSGKNGRSAVAVAATGLRRDREQGMVDLRERARCEGWKSARGKAYLSREGAPDPRPQKRLDWLMDGRKANRPQKRCSHAPR